VRALFYALVDLLTGGDHAGAAIAALGIEAVPPQVLCVLCVGLRYC
jgi:hypothetical protein